MGTVVFTAPLCTQALAGFDYGTNFNMRRRCNFELQFCELSGIPGSYDSIRVVIDHRDGKRRYAATEPIKPSFGTAAVPSLAFQCGIYPSKTVQLRLMGGSRPESDQEGRPWTPRMLGRSSSLNWQLLATAPLPLGQLAPSSADQDASTVASSTAVTPISTRGHSMDTDHPPSPSPFHNMSGADDDDAGSDSGQLFSTDSLAAAAASLVAQQQQQQQQYGGSSSSTGAASSGLMRRSQGRRSSGDESSSLSQVSGLWVAGDSQVTRMTLLWSKPQAANTDDAVIAQEVVVIAKLMEARPSFSNLFGLRLSPSKTSLNQAPPSPVAKQSSGGLTPRGNSRQWDTVTEEDQGAAESGKAPRRVTFDAAAPSALAPAATDILDTPKDLASTPVPDRTTAAAAKAEAEADEDAQEAAKRDFLALILSTLASAPSMESEAGSSSNILAASPAQLAAAASLPRAPSMRDLSVFAAAAGLPIETVTQAAATTRLSVTDAGGNTSKASSFRGWGSNNNSASFSGNNSAGGSPSRAPKPPLPTAFATSNGAGSVPAKSAFPAVNAAAAAEAGMGASVSDSAGAPPASTASPLDATAAATVAAATAAAEAVGMQPLVAPVVLSTGEPILSTPAVSVADATPSIPSQLDASTVTHSAAPAAGSATTASAGAESASQKVVTSTALVTSAKDGDEVSGWEPKQLAVVTATAAVPESEAQQNRAEAASAFAPAPAAEFLAAAGHSPVPQQVRAAADAAAAPALGVPAGTAAKPAAPGVAAAGTETAASAPGSSAAAIMQQPSSTSSRGSPDDLAGAGDAASPVLPTARTSSSPIQLAGPGSQLAGLSEKYNSLFEQQQQQHGAMQETKYGQGQGPAAVQTVAPSEVNSQPSGQVLLRPDDILAVMPGLAPAASTAGALRERQAVPGISPGVQAATGTTSSISAGPELAREAAHASTGVKGSMPIKAVPAAPAGPDLQESLPTKQDMPVYTGVTDSWEAAPPPPSPRLLSAALGGQAASADMLLAAPAPAHGAAAGGTPAAPATIESISEMLAVPSTTAGAVVAESSTSTTTAATPFTAPTTLQQQSPAVPTAAGTIYPAIPARGASAEILTAPESASGASNRLLAVLAVRQSSLNKPSLSTSRTASGQLSLTQPSVSRSASGALAGSVVSVLVPAAGAVLATSSAVLPAVAGTTAAAGVGVSVFLLRQATWLATAVWQLAVPWLLWAALAGPRALIWAAQQAWPYVAGFISSTMAPLSSTISSSTLGSRPAGYVPAQLAVPASAAAPSGSTERLTAAMPAWVPFQHKSQRITVAGSRAGVSLQPAAAVAHVSGPLSGSSPIAADILAARASLAGPVANSSNLPPSQGGPGFRVWAPAAGRSTAASLAAAAMSPLAFPQWLFRTATILFEVVVWVLYLSAGGPLMLSLGVLRYTGLLPAKSPGQPALSSVAAAGGFAAQGQIMPAPEADTLPAPLPAPSQAPDTTASVPGSSGLAVTSMAGSVQGPAEAPAGELSAAVGAVGSSVPLSATAVPEEHELIDDEVVSPGGSFISPRNMAFRPEPPTPAPSMEVPGSGTQRTWSLTFLTAALSRLGSSSLITTPTPDTAATTSISTTPVLPSATTTVEAPSASSSMPAALRPLVGTGAARGLSRLAKGSANTAAGTAAYGDTTAAISSRSTSGTVSRSSSSSSTGSGQLNGHGGSWWFGSRRAPPTEVSRLQGLQGMQPLGTKSPAVAVRTTGLIPPAGQAASSVIQQTGSNIDSFTGRGWWPSWMYWGTAMARPLAVNAVAPIAATSATAGTGTASMLARSSAVPATPPPTPHAGSFSRHDSENSTGAAAASAASPLSTSFFRGWYPSAWSWANSFFGFSTGPRVAVVPASTSAQHSAAGAGSEVTADVVAAATEGCSHLMAAAAHASQAFMLLVVAPVVWLCGAFHQLFHPGLVTAEWLASLALWWAVLPLRLAWWGVMLPGRMMVDAWEGVKWVAEHVSVPHDDRVEVVAG